MILVDNVTVISEEDSYVIYCNTGSGIYFQNVDSEFAGKVTDALNGRKSFYGSVLDGALFTSCCLHGKDKAVLKTVANITKGTWAEVIPVAMELKIPIYISPELLVQELDPNDSEHEAFVAELIKQEELFDQSNQIKKMMQQMTQAVEDERFEEAALLRDKIEKLSSK